jgi:uncharacterized protein (UPF0147 family)
MNRTKESKMRMHVLAETPPWDWPAHVDAEILAVLRDREALPSERLLAAELAGDLIVLHDTLAEELLRILASPEESEALRAQAAISFGAALEEADVEGFDDRGPPAASEAMLRRAQAALRDTYQDPGVPKEVRRRALEGSVRAPEPWHTGAVRAAYHDGDREWMLTAVFCMSFVQGFDAEIVEALQSGDAKILLHAVQAAGDMGVDDAWPFVERLVLSAASGETLLPDDPYIETPLLLAAMSAVAGIRPEEAHETLSGLVESEDEDVAETAQEILDMVEGLWAQDDEDDDLEPTWH